MIFMQKRSAKPPIYRASYEMSGIFLSCSCVSFSSNLDNSLYNKDLISNLSPLSILARDLQKKKIEVIMRIFILRFEVPSEKRDDVVKALLSITRPSEAQIDCLSCRLYSEAAESNSLVLLGEWESDKSFERFIRSNDFRQILDLVEWAKSPPDIKFFKVTNTAGLELIEVLRGG